MCRRALRHTLKTGRFKQRGRGVGGACKHWRIGFCMTQASKRVGRAGDKVYVATSTGARGASRGGREAYSGARDGRRWGSKSTSIQRGVFSPCAVWERGVYKSKQVGGRGRRGRRSAAGARVAAPDAQLHAPAGKKGEDGAPGAAAGIKWH